MRPELRRYATTRAIGAALCVLVSGCDGETEAGTRAAAWAAPDSADAARLAVPAVVDSTRKLGVGSHEREFGKVAVGAELRHTFELHNRTEHVIELKKASASCGCTRYLFDKRSWAPGESGTLTVILDTTGKLGLVSATVGVVLIDAAQQQTFERFAVECVVARDEWNYADPSRIDFGIVEADRPAEARFTIGCNSKSTSALPVRARLARELPVDPAAESVERSGDVEVHWDANGALRMAAGGSTRRVEATGRVVWSGERSSAELSSTLRFELVFPDGRLEQVPLVLLGSVRPELEFEPRGLLVAGLAQSETRSTRVVVEGSALNGVAPTVRSSSEWIAAAFDAGERMASPRLVLTVTVHAPPSQPTDPQWIEIGLGERAYRLPVAVTLR